MKWSCQDHLLTLSFLATHRLNIGKFFYEMVHRWLIPGQRLDVPFFLTTDFHLPEVDAALYTVAEMVVRLPEDIDHDRLTHNLQIIATEVRLGMVSVYHASKILEIHGSAADDKGGAIQEKIATLVQTRPDDIDYDIFGEMQHFFVMSSDLFKLGRTAHHLSRIIALSYLFQKSLEKSVESVPDRRHVRLKLAPVKVDFPWGRKRVLAVCVGLNLLKRTEFFEEQHLLRAIHNLAPQAQAVPDSFFTNQQESLHTLYLEIEKQDGSDFTQEEMALFRKQLPDEIRRSVEVTQRPLFMPRNEEEVMRHVVTLARELRYVRDLPQLILAFDQQTESELFFNVILVRVVSTGTASIADRFAQQPTFLRLIPDRTQQVGMVRKRYPKEATVFRVAFDSTPYFRDDHAIDLYQARHEVVAELQKILGEVRDYNGGMIAKQLELLEGLRGVAQPTSRWEEKLLDKFFHSLFPIEMRSICSVEALKNLFECWKKLLQAFGESKVVFETEEAIFVVVRSGQEVEILDNYAVVARLEEAEEKFLGYIYFSPDAKERGRFLSSVDAKKVSV